MSCLYFISSAVGDYFVSCSQDQTAKLWCTERTFPLRSFIGHTYDVDVSYISPGNFCYVNYPLDN